MSVSAVAPTPFYQDPDRLPIGLPQASAEDSKATQGGKHLSMFAEGDDSPSFWDLLDVVNPLQHIPVVGNLYREATGDKIGVGARLVGGALLGGPVGFIASAIDCMVEESTGTDTGGHMLALFRDEGDSAPGTAPATQFAQTPAAPAPSAPAAEAVSSSPAKVMADTGAAAANAPVIALPDSAAAGASQPMIFSLDGVQSAPAAAAPQKVAMAAPAAAAPEAIVGTPIVGTPTALTPGANAAAPAGKPLRGGNRFMAVPQRSSAEAQPMPQVTVPVSTSGARSNVPVTGRSPQAAVATTTTGQRAQVSQEALANHPMMPPTDASGQTAANPDWFTAAWGQALDKYQRANQRNDKSATSTTSTLQ